MARTTFTPARIVVYEVDEPNEGLRFYRIVRSDDRDTAEYLDSFRSHNELQMEPRHIEDRSAAIHMGLSMYSRLAIARQTAQRFRKIGGYVAEVELARGRGVNMARTGHPGHVWGRPDQLIALVRRVYSAE